MATQTPTTPTKDRIQKSILLRAPRSRVWRAVADPQEFGSWFGLKIEGQVSPGSKVTGTIVPTTVDATVAKQQREYEGLQFEITIDRVEPDYTAGFDRIPAARRAKAFAATEQGWTKQMKLIEEYRARS